MVECDIVTGVWAGVLHAGATYILLYPEPCFGVISTATQGNLGGVWCTSLYYFPYVGIILVIVACHIHRLIFRRYMPNQRYLLGRVMTKCSKMSWAASFDRPPKFHLANNDFPIFAPTLDAN